MLIKKHKLRNRCIWKEFKKERVFKQVNIKEVALFKEQTVDERIGGLWSGWISDGDRENY